MELAAPLESGDVAVHVQGLVFDESQSLSQGGANRRVGAVVEEQAGESIVVSPSGYLRL